MTGSKTRLVRAPPSKMSISGLVVAAIAFIATAGWDTSFAQQTFGDTISNTIDKIEAGSLSRRLGLGLLALWAIASLTRKGVRRPHPRPVLTSALAGFFLLALASPLWALDPSLTIRRVVVLGLIVLGSYAYAERFGVFGLTKLTVAISGITVAAAVFSQIGFGPFTPFDGEWRLAGIMHPVALSWFCGIGAIGCFALLRELPHRHHLLIGCGLAFLGALILTRTRTGLASCLLGLSALFILSNPRKLRERVAVTSVLAGVAISFALLISSLSGASLFQDYESLIEVTSLGRQDAVAQADTFTGRLPIWEASIQLASDRPFLGYGYNAFAGEAMIEYVARIAGWVATSAHSGYIETLVSLGLVGLFLVLGLMGGALTQSIRLAVNHSAYRFAAAVFVWLAVNLIFEAPIFYDPLYTELLVWALLIETAVFADSRGNGRPVHA